MSKLAAEHYATVYRHRYGVDCRVARIGNPYGPGQRRLAIYDLARRALREGAPLHIRGDGCEVRDFIHGEDAARALVAIARRGEPGGVYNVGSGRPVSLREVATCIASSAGLPTGAVEADGQVEEGKVSVFYPCVQRLAGLGFQATRTLSEGIAQTVEWLRNEA